MLKTYFLTICRWGHPWLQIAALILRKIRLWHQSGLSWKKVFNLCSKKKSSSADSPCSSCSWSCLELILPLLPPVETSALFCLRIDNLYSYVAYDPSSKGSLSLMDAWHFLWISMRNQLHHISYVSIWVLFSGNPALLSWQFLPFWVFLPGSLTPSFQEIPPLA